MNLSQLNDDARMSKFLPWSRVFFNVTIFRTEVVITHVTKNRIVLCLLSAHRTRWRHVHELLLAFDRINVFPRQKASNIHNDRSTTATSSGLPIRPRGTVVTSFFLNCSLICSFWTRPLRLRCEAGGRVDRTRADGVDADHRCFRSSVQERANDRIAALVAL